jgi:chromosome segregation ATPase
MRPLPLAEMLRVWSQSPSAAAAARSLGLSRRTLYNRVQSASPEELRQAITQIAAAYETQLTGERQTRLQERAAAQAQMKAVRKEGVRDRTLLAKRLAACDDELAKALRELTILNLRGSGMERPLEQPQWAIERLTREKQALREEIARLKSTRTERAQGPGNVPVIRRVKRLITLEEDDPGRGGEDRLG